MASISISIIPPTKVTTSTEITGDEKLVTVNGQGKPTTITVSQILDKVDDSIVDRVEGQVMEQVLSNVDEQVEDRIDDILDNVGKLTWNEV